MDQELRLQEIEKQLSLLKDHKHTGTDFKRVDFKDILNATSLAYAKAYLGSAQSTSGSADKVLLDTAPFVASGITFENNGFTILTAGKYLIFAKASFSALGDQVGARTMIYNNGNLLSTVRITQSAPGTNLLTVFNFGLFSLAVGDVIDMRVTTSNNPSSEPLVTGEGNTEMSIIKIA